ncbi:hypothetical protein [Rasiella sp. SM2506]|uniref:hypothetical protein n=1 Tax=Rasiella sp. SM2506 TaxID=3423914 RepID=UPI003D7B016E
MDLQKKDKHKLRFGFLLKLGIAAGLYPLLFYYGNNFTLINTWGHLLFFLGLFIVLPVITVVLGGNILNRISSTVWRMRGLTFINLFAFGMFLQLCLLADLKKSVSVIILAICSMAAFFIYRFLKKIMVLQFLLSLIGLVILVPKIYTFLSASDAWQELPDAITDVTFTQTPNIYFIQPDGYVNPSELEKGYYKIDNKNFEDFLSVNNFKNYANFRSNYGSTLSTNSAVFAMKHHYYNGGENFSETLNARNVIMGSNPVLQILKHNNYVTYFISEKPYLLQTRPTLGYDFTNFGYDEIPYISTGLKTTKEVLPALTTYLNDGIKSPKFYFIQILKPGHINNRESYSVGVDGERDAWIKKLQLANTLLKETVATITAKDPNGLIIIMSDHGGYVGFNYTNQSYLKVEDPQKVNSIFSTILSIKWPGMAPEFDSQLVTSVNVFRILFAHLANDTQYLSNLEPDTSYLLIKEGKEQGVYQYIDDSGTITFKKK